MGQRNGLSEVAQWWGDWRGVARVVLAPRCWHGPPEMAGLQVLDAAGILYQREVRIDFSCFTSHKKFARLDFVCEQKDRRVILEVDERQHADQSYSIGCDVSRMLDVVAALVCEDNTRPTLWLRFNPNAYKVDGVRAYTSRKERYRRLLAILKAPATTASFGRAVLVQRTACGVSREARRWLLGSKALSIDTPQIKAHML